jgi:hypothetical protein
MRFYCIDRPKTLHFAPVLHLYFPKIERLRRKRLMNGLNEVKVIIEDGPHHTILTERHPARYYGDRGTKAGYQIGSEYPFRNCSTLQISPIPNIPSNIVVQKRRI